MQILSSQKVAASTEEAMPLLPDTYKIKEALQKAVVETHREEYGKLTDIWKGLETKAQATVTIAGIFIAAAFAFVREFKALQLSEANKIVLIAAFSCLVLSIILSILVLTLRKVSPPPTGGEMRQIAADVLRLRSDETADQHDESIPDLYLDFFNEHVILWQRVIVSASKVIKWKVRCLWAAQWLLMFATFLIVWLTLSIVLR